MNISKITSVLSECAKKAKTPDLAKIDTSKIANGAKNLSNEKVAKLAEGAIDAKYKDKLIKNLDLSETLGRAMTKKTKASGAAKIDTSKITSVLNECAKKAKTPDLAKIDTSKIANGAKNLSNEKVAKLAEGAIDAKYKDKLIKNLDLSETLGRAMTKKN